MKTLKQLLFLGITIIAGTGIAHAQDMAIKQIADGKSFQFKAQSAQLNNTDAVASGDLTTSANNHIPLKGNFMVMVKPDSVSSILPYFDDAQSQDQPVNAAGEVAVTLNETPTRFSAKQYDYVVEQKKKGEVEIVLTPKDNTNIRKFTFDINPDGTAKLVVSVGSIKRITYEGNVSM